MSGSRILPGELSLSDYMANYHVILRRLENAFGV